KPASARLTANAITAQIAFKNVADFIELSFLNCKITIQQLRETRKNIVNKKIISLWWRNF
ncbi:MAG: hypothetical protein KAT39_01595, partial [Alphaproteobacteria bacterium]|nr:hypothetical protein [Alphaproteobacteria bacterium]